MAAAIGEFPALWLYSVDIASGRKAMLSENAVMKSIWCKAWQ